MEVTMDLKKIIRLKESAQSVASKVNKETYVCGFTDAYNKLVKAVRETLDKESLAEFDAIINTIDDGSEHNSVAFLAQLQGYLEGMIKAETWKAQIQSEAEAYAKERVKIERGVGFKGS